MVTRCQVFSNVVKRRTGEPSFKMKFYPGFINALHTNNHCHHLHFSPILENKTISVKRGQTKGGNQYWMLELSRYWIAFAKPSCTHFILTHAQELYPVPPLPSPFSPHRNHQSPLGTDSVRMPECHFRSSAQPLTLFKLSGKRAGVLHIHSQWKVSFHLTIGLSCRSLAAGWKNYKEEIIRKETKRNWIAGMDR